MPFRPRLTVATVALLATVALAQPPIQLNTTVHSFTSVSATPWVGECWSYTDALGRDYALICRGNSGFSVYEITNPVAPVFRSSIAATASDLKDVKVSGDYAYCVQQGGDVLVVSLVNPAAISVVATISAPGGGHNGNAQGNTYAYSRDGGSPNGVEFYDISNLASPVFRSLYDPPGFRAHDAELDMNGTICYVHTFQDNTTHILDVSNLASPQLLGIIPYGNHSGETYHAPGGAIVHGAMREAAGGHCRFFDVTDPANPVFLSMYQPPTAVNISIHNAVIVDRYFVIAYYADYLRILDMKNPSAPVEVGIYDPDPTNAGAAVFDGAWSVSHVRTLPNGDHRFILTESFRTPRGFWVIDFTPPPAIDIDASTTGAGDFAFALSGVDPGTDVFNVISLQTSGPLGAGPVAGIASDAFFQFLSPAGTPFTHPFVDASGDYAFALPPGALLAGLTVDLVSFGRKNGQFMTSPVGRIGF